MAVGTHGAVHEVVEWSANYGYCKTQPPRRLAIPTVEAVVGDAVHFKFSVNSAWNMDATQWAGHEVYKYGTKEAWEACAQDISETPTRLVTVSFLKNDHYHLVAVDFLLSLVKVLVCMPVAISRLRVGGSRRATVARG